MSARWAAMSNGSRWAMTAGSAASALVSHSALRSVLSLVTRCGSLPVVYKSTCCFMVISMQSAYNTVHCCASVYVARVAVSP
jgi:hypothetical protein